MEQILKNNEEIKMKKLASKALFVIKAVLLVFIFLVVQAFLTGCDDFSVFSDKKKIHGSGNYVTRTMQIDGFHSIIVETFGNVELRQSENFEVSYTIDDNITKYVDIYKSGDNLIIDLDHDYDFQDYRYKILISMPDVRRLTTNSAGSINSEDKIVSDELYLTANSAGNLTLEIDVDKLHTNINSAGNIHLAGFADEHRSTLQSAGNLSAFGLETNKTYITVSSAGNARVLVNDYLDVNLSSVGSLYYKGHPQIHYNVSSMGNLIDAN